MNQTFNAFRIYEEDGKSRGRIVQASLDELSPGAVVIRAAYSGVNYKDALAGTGSGKVVRRFPLIGGIDVSGTVEASADPRFKPGDAVLITGFDLGVSHDGGYAQYVRAPGDWVVPLPNGLSLSDAMAIGTAGFTAALSLDDMERNGLTPASGPVIVTGATGGVGSVAIQLLAKRGYTITAFTGKDESDYLRQLGASEILLRSTVTFGTKPLEKATWAGAVDAVGGETLAWLTRTMMVGGTIASSGLAGGHELHTTVMPFILRGVKLLGIDSVACPRDRRLQVWQRLATDLRPDHLATMIKEISLEGLHEAFSILLKGQARGRFVVNLV